MVEGAKETAKRYSVERSATKALEVYAGLKKGGLARKKLEKKEIIPFLQQVSTEWDLLTNFTKATVGAFQ